MNTGSTLVCFALKEEAGPFRRAMAGRGGVSILVTGIGRANAKRNVENFLAANSPSAVLTCGFAGGLDPALQVGDVIFATEHKSLAEKISAAGAKEAKFFFAEKIAVTVQDKQAVRRLSGADAVEMESKAIEAVCRDRGIPCATVRVISDTANENLPLDFNQLAGPDLSIHYGKLAAAILKQPGKIRALMRLQKNCAFAARRLADVLAKCV